jgi:hypothetical protein
MEATRRPKCERCGKNHPDLGPLLPFTEDKSLALKGPGGRSIGCALDYLLAWFESGELRGLALNSELSCHWTESGYSYGPKLERVSAMLRSAAYVTNSKDRAPQSSPIRLFRGCHEGSEVALSWSRSIAAASWFARGSLDRKKPQASLIVGDFAPEAILGYFQELGEDEYLVDPRFIDVSNLERTPAIKLGVYRHAQQHIIDKVSYPGTGFSSWGDLDLDEAHEECPGTTDAQEILAALAPLPPDLDYDAPLGDPSVDRAKKFAGEYGNLPIPS